MRTSLALQEGMPMPMPDPCYSIDVCFTYCHSIHLRNPRDQTPLGRDSSFDKDSSKTAAPGPRSLLRGLRHGGGAPAKLQLKLQLFDLWAAYYLEGLRLAHA